MESQVFVAFPRTTVDFGSNCYDHSFGQKWELKFIETRVLSYRGIGGLAGPRTARENGSEPLQTQIVPKALNLKPGTLNPYQKRF